MSGVVINLIIRLIAGALGGNLIGSELKNVDLGTIGNSIVGAAGGTFLTTLIPLLARTASIIAQAAGAGVSGGIVGQAVVGGVSGAILTAIIGLIKNAMTAKPRVRNISRKRGNLRTTRAS